MPFREPVADFVSDTTTGSDAAYATGEQVGGVSSSSLQWALRNGQGYIKSCVVTLASAAGQELDLVLYNDTFTPGTDNSAFAEAAADKAKSVGVINIPAASFKSVGNGILRATIAVADLPYKCVDGATLYGNLIARGALDLVTDFVIVVGLGVIRG